MGGSKRLSFQSDHGEDAEHVKTLAAENTRLKERLEAMTKARDALLERLEDEIGMDAHHYLGAVIDEDKP